MRFVDLESQRQRIGRQIEQRITAVLEHGRYIMGPEVEELERELCSFTGARYAITCGSGTDALLLPLMAWEVGPGDAVFVPSFTFAATAEAVALVGATPVFVDVMEDSFNIDPESLTAAIASTSQLRPAAVVAVDLFGAPADYPALQAIASRNGLHLLADAAQSFGATFGGRSVGALADVTATSFFPSKPLGCYGDGGAMMTDDQALAEVLRSLRVHGQGAHKYENVRIGTNARLDTIQAAVLMEKLDIFPSELEARSRIANTYRDGLGTTVVTPKIRDATRSAWAQYTVRVPNRDEVARRLTEANLPVAIYYPCPLHRQPAYSSYPMATEELVVSDSVANEVLSIPIHPYLRDDETERVVETLLATIHALKPDGRT